MSVDQNDLNTNCPPILCCIRDCVVDMLNIGGGVKTLCKSDEEILFNLGLSTTTKTKRKLGSCSPIETRNAELVFHITAKQCEANEQCQTLYIQRWIEEKFNQNKCFCHFSSGPAELVDSDIIREYREKNGSNSIVRQLVFEVPFKIRNGNPQVHIKCCSHDSEI